MEKLGLRYIIINHFYNSFQFNRRRHLRCSAKKGVLKNFTNFTGKHLFRPNTLLKETPAQASSWEICEIFKNLYFEEHLRRSASNSKKETIHLSFKYLPEPWIVISVDEINRNRTFNCIFFFSFLTKYIEYVCTLIFYDLKKSLICFIL